LFDVNRAAAEQTAAAFGIERVYQTLDEAFAAPGAIFDLAVPGDQTLAILERLPIGSAVLMQKPMGLNLADARRIRACTADRGLTAAVNLQLRFAPAMLALRELLATGSLGTIVDIDVRIVIDQPWHLWKFTEGASRLEIPYHSIHYLDAIRWLAGEPLGAYCRTVEHPALPALRDTRSSIILDYGDALRCSLVLNHTHRAGPRYRASDLMIEGTRGAARVTLGVNLSYPNGPSDTLELTNGGEWRPVALRGSWFTEAFEGPMSNLQRVVSGEDPALVSPVDDAIKTMALIEACYISSEAGGIPIPPSD
jgi:predicted dehydrogenase